MKNFSTQKKIIKNRSFSIFLGLLLFSPFFIFSQQTTYTFLTAGASGSVGPTQAQLNTAYAATNLNGLVISNAGIQSFTVPNSGLYEIDISGAGGGDAPTHLKIGGLGARMKGEFNLNAGQVIQILVGQRGTNGCGCGSGGGGTYVASNGTLLIAAGGGGGCSSDQHGVNAVITLSGTTDSPSVSLGGTNGSGGLTCLGGTGNAANGGGGGGYVSGLSGNGLSSSGGGGQSFLNGGIGGAAAPPYVANGSPGVAGGFGGGGGTSYCTVGGAGGGGYSGGAGGQHASRCVLNGFRTGGGGGGSFNSGINQLNAVAFNSGNGSVKITQLVVNNLQSQSCVSNCSLYVISSIASDPVNNIGTNLTLGDDQVSGSVPLGFTFSFMCNSYTSCIVSSNGFLSFNPNCGNGCCTGMYCPTPNGNPNNYVAFAWCDLYPVGGGSIKYQTIGTAPNRVFVLTYSLIPYYPSSSAPFNSGQIKLFETTNIIEIHNGVVGSTQTKTQGIMNLAGTSGFAIAARNATNWTTTGDAYRWSPQYFPSNLGNIAGDTSVCSGSSTSYSIPALVGVNSYSWTLPSGWSGSFLNNNITGISNGSSGTISVTASSSCGISSTSTLAVTVNPLPTISVNSGSICSGQPLTLNASGASNYYWAGAQLPSATGGVITYSNGYTIHTFTAGGNFISPLAVNAEVLVVAGGGGGGGSYAGSGGGAGGVRYSGSYSIQSNSSTSVTIGSGGIGGSFVTAGTNGSNSVFGNIISNGGGGGGTYGNISGLNGGSGGGAGWQNGSFGLASPVTNPVQGYDGGVTGTSPSNHGAGGGGAAGTPNNMGNGGPGVLCGISGTNVYYGGGGAAGTDHNVALIGGIGGGGNGGPAYVNGQNGTPNSGGGGGGGGGYSSSPIGGNGGSGIVIIRYFGQITTSTAIVSPSVTTIYSVTGISSLGCIGNTSTIAVTVYSLPVISITGNNTLCAGGSLNLSAGGASTYTWSTNSNLVNISVTPLTNTTYTLSGNSSLGCFGNTPTMAVTVYSLPVISIAGNNTLCAGGSLNLSAGGASTYTWSTNSNLVNISVSPPSNTTYTLSGKSSFGCLGNTPTIAVTVYSLPAVTISSPSFICIGENASLTAQGASSYIWNTGSTSVFIITTPTANTIYTVTGTSAFGCSNSTVKSISVIPLPLISITNPNASSGTLAICSGEMAILTANGASSYTWSNGSNASSITISPLNNTTYSLSGTNLNGCSSYNTTLAVTSNTLPIVSITGTNTICAGNSAVLFANGANTYTWSNSLGNSNSILISPLSNTTYSLIGKNIFGCIGITATKSINVLPSPTLSIVGGSFICSGSFITQSVSGANSFTWSTGSNLNSISINPLINTTFSVSGTDGNGCINAVSKLITVGNLPVIAVNSGFICAGNVFTIIPNGASTYTFSSGSNTVSPLNNSSYFVTGTSVEGCLSNGPALCNVIVNQLPNIFINSGAICLGNSFTFSPNGANTYTYLNGSSVVSPTSSTSYSIIGTSLLGCTSLSPAISNLTVNPIPIISTNNGSVCSGNSFTIVPSGAASYSFSNGSYIVTPTISSNYSITGSSSFGCVSSNVAICSVSVMQLPLISVNSGTICSGATFTMFPTNALTYTFSNGSNTIIPTVNSSFSVTGTNSQGCISSITAVANVTLIPIPIITINSGAICSGKIFTFSPSGCSTYTFSSISSTVSPLVTSSYSVSGTNSLGCISGNAIATVTVNALPTISLITTSSPSICVGESINIMAFGANSYTFSSIANGSIVAVSPTVTTNYSVTGTNLFGCEGSSSQLITVNPLPTITVSDATICPGVPFVIIPNGALNYTFSGGSSTVFPMQTSSYSITGSDNNGCISLFPVVTTIYAINSITVTISGTDSICIGKSANLIASGAGNYVWSTGEITPTIMPMPLSNTNYSVIGGSGSCSDTSFISVIIKPSPNIITSSSKPNICLGETATLSASGANSYTWDSGSNLNYVIVSPTITSNYSVTGSYTNGCINTATIQQKVNSCTEIQDKINTNDFVYKVYPNPNNGFFTLETSAAINLEIYNGCGQIILIKKYEEGVHQINLFDYAKGIYFITIRKETTIKTFKIIKE